MITPHAKIKSQWPNAIRIEGPDRCPVCGLDAEYSFVLAEYDTRYLSRGDLWQHVGYRCVACGFSNAGGRIATMADVEQDGIGE